MTWAYILSYKVVILSKGKIKIPDLQNTRWSLLKREEDTYHHNEKLTMEMPGFLSSRKGVSLLLIPDYSGINKGQSFPDRSNPAHRKPPVKCILTFCLWFPLKSFRVVGLTLRSLIHFGFIFFVWCYKMFQFHSFTCSWAFRPATRVEETLFMPLYICASFVKDNLCIGVCIYLWVLYFVPLIYISVFLPYCLDGCLDDYSFVV